MSSPDDGRFRELVARLSDGLISEDEAGELNRILKDDPIAQEMYLDHLYVDGLLEREFIGAGAGTIPVGLPEGVLAGRSPRPASSSIATDGAPQARRASWAWPVLVAGLCAAATAAMWLRPPSKDGGGVTQLLALSDSGFESGSIVASPTSQVAGWYGDDADIVPDHQGVKPLEGNRMVRFVRSSSKPENTCDLYQIIDLSDVQHEIADGDALIEASAAFNTIQGIRRDGGSDVDDCIFGVTVFAYSEDPSGKPHMSPVHTHTPLTFSGNQVRADADTGTWEHVKTRMALPPDSKYLIVQLSAMRVPSGMPPGQVVIAGETPVDFPGQFADGVSVKLVASED